MKRLIVYILALVGTVLVLDFFSSIVLNSAYDKMIVGMSGGKINHVLSKDSVSLLAVGNSRCAKFINPKYLGGKAYNLSHNGMSLSFHAGAIDLILKNPKSHIDTIILNLEITEWFHHEGSYTKDIQHLKYFYGQNEYIRREIDHLGENESLKFKFSAYRFNGKVLSTFKNAITSINNSLPEALTGYEQTPPTEMDSINVFRSAPRFFAYIPPDTLHLSQRHMHRMLHLKSLCDSLDVKLICYLAPTFTAAQNKKVVLEPEIELLSGFLKDNQIPLLNYYQNPTTLGLQSPWDWVDAMHLNDNGAEIFSKRLREDINRLK